jgi:hypothetical protein
LADTVPDFLAWTLTTALFNTIDGEAQRVAAAKGKQHSSIAGIPLTLDPATIPFIFIFYFFYDLAYTAMLVAYTIEILPYNIRARGFAVVVSVCLLRT